MLPAILCRLSAIFADASQRARFPLLALLGVATFVASAPGKTLTGVNLEIKVENGGDYSVHSTTTGFSFSGALSGAAQNITADSGQDAIGAFQRLSFSWQDAGRAVNGSIRLYDQGDLLLFSDTLVPASAHPASPFPCFHSPSNLYHFSYQDDVFAAPQASFADTTGPWMFFDAQDRAMLISPASHFIIARMTGLDTNQIASDFAPTLTGLPAGFTRETLIAFGGGINATFDRWGQALTDFAGRTRPANDADFLLKYYGYWTDAQSAYYYNYDLKLGYEATLKKVVDTYRREDIPIRYFQLDSWWYRKSATYFDGTPVGPDNPLLPAGDWNNYGGLLRYKPAAFVFPDGMAHFQTSIDLPLILHNRWVDPASPYHQKYKISGIAAVDPGYWNEIGDYLVANRAGIYEQDWLQEILAESPELTSGPVLSETFFGDMAAACAARGIDMQYCLPTPRCFLQGIKYDNLTTIRVASDRFNRTKWEHFLFTSRLASALGIWPWTDLYFSNETRNLILGNLSAGPVGTGDPLGNEDRTNLLQAMRADGVLIKPDAVLVPVDSAYLDLARNVTAPIIATTYSSQTTRRTVYVAVVEPRGLRSSPYTVTREDLGFDGAAWVYDYLAGTGRPLAAGESFNGVVDARGVSNLIMAPTSPSGVTVFGDLDKITSMGRQRIASLDDAADQVTAQVLISPQEPFVTLHGYGTHAPTVTVENGTAGAVDFDPATGHFTVRIAADPAAPLIQVDPVHEVGVTFRP